MRRFAATIFSSISLIACFLALTIWAYSYLYVAAFDFNVGTQSHYEVMYWPGQLGLSRLDQAKSMYTGMPPQWRMERRNTPGWSGYPTPLGLTFMWLPSPPNPFLPDGWQVVVAYPLVAAVTAAGPLMWVMRCFRRRRIHPGFCATCGYDLRASTGLCPECGTALATGSRQQPAE